MSNKYLPAPPIHPYEFSGALGGGACYNSSMDISIVIPEFNEAGKIARDVEAAGEFLAGEGMSGEILIVDDGSTDDSADRAEEAMVPDGVERRVIRCEVNRGKGFAVRTGMMQTRGDIIMFADAGLCIPYEQCLRGVALIREGGYDIAHGSRALPESIITRPKSLYRRMFTRIFRFAMPILAGTPRTLSDTQCGFKMYRGEVGRKLYTQCVCGGFLFDIETVLRAIRSGWTIGEFPVTWHSDPDSRLHPARSIPRLIGELRAIRRAVKEPDTNE